MRLLGHLAIGLGDYLYYEHDCWMPRLIFWGDLIWFNKLGDACMSSLFTYVSADLCSYASDNRNLSAGVVKGEQR